MRISDGMSASFADGRKLVVEGKGEVVVVRSGTEIICKLDPAEDFGGLVPLVDGFRIAGLIFHFRVSEGKPVAAVGGRLVLFEEKPKNRVITRSVKLDDILEGGWDRQWVTQILKTSAANTIRLEVGTLDRDGKATYMEKDIDLSTLKFRKMAESG
jgi:hypothetical protein